MPYRYIEDIAIADVAFEAWGATLEEMFVAAGDALLNVMVEEPGSVRDSEVVEISLENSSLEMLLFDLLNEMIFFKDSRLLLLRVASASISLCRGDYGLDAVLSGERIEPARHPLSVDVKAVTLHHFRVEESADRWRSQVVLDI